MSSKCSVTRQKVPYIYDSHPAIFIAEYFMQIIHNFLFGRVKPECHSVGSPRPGYSQMNDIS